MRISLKAPGFLLDRFNKPAGAAWLLLGASLLMWCSYGSWDLKGADETRYVQVAKELLGRTNWLVLEVHGEPYTEKPPLPFWLFAGMLKLNGGNVSAWAVRLPSVLFGIATVLLIYDIGRRRFGVRAGLLAGFVILTANLFVRQTPTARLDVIFTGWITASLWAWLSAEAARPLTARQAFLFWGCLAGAFFTKGPLALIAVLGPVAFEAWRERSWQVWRALRPLPGLGCLAALIFGWLWSQSHLLGAEYARDTFATGTFERIFKGSHANPIWYYVDSLFTTSFMPWTVFAVFALLDLWRTRKTSFPSGMRPLLIWPLLLLIMLHVSSGKRHQYLLPVLPPMALLVGWYIDRRLLDRLLSVRWNRVAWALGFAAAGGVAMFTVEAWIDVESFREAELYLLKPHLVMLGIYAVFIAWMSVWLASQSTWRSLLIFLYSVLFASQLILLTVGNWAGNPKDDALLFVATVQSRLGEDRHVVGALGEADRPKYHVYGDYEVERLGAKTEPFANPEALPSLLVCLLEDLHEYEEAASEAGFIPIYEMRCAGDDLVLLERRSAPGEAAIRAEDRPPEFAMQGAAGREIHTFDGS